MSSNLISSQREYYISHLEANPIHMSIEGEGKGEGLNLGIKDAIESHLSEHEKKVVDEAEYLINYLDIVAEIKTALDCDNSELELSFPETCNERGLTERLIGKKTWADVIEKFSEILSKESLEFIVKKKAIGPCCESPGTYSNKLNSNKSVCVHCGQRLYRYFNSSLNLHWWYLDNGRQSVCCDVPFKQSPYKNETVQNSKNLVAVCYTCNRVLKTEVEDFAAVGLIITL